MGALPRSSDLSCDVLVVGGGPAGSTIAALLARDGFTVTVLEKDRHPRFHIGESLLPRNLPLLRELGVLDEIDKIGMPKYGIEFTSPHHNKTVEFEFARSLDKSFASAYQVRRSVFDHLLLKNAAAKGAAVIEGCRVSDVQFPDDGGALVTGVGENGAARVWRARFLVDASGRDTLLADKFAMKRANTRHNTAAIFGHFTNAKRLPGKAEGHISIFWFDYGWFWFIPLADGTTSVGAVCRPDYVRTRKGDVTSFFMATIALCPALAERLKDATLTAPAIATGNYSYRADRMAGRGYILLGDAFAFIDPVFSTGVYLAMMSAFKGAQAVKTALRSPERAPAALRRFEKEVRRGLDTFSWYIYRMTRAPLRDMFMNPRNILRVEEAMMSFLGGDVFRRSQVQPRLLVFKFFFYVNSLVYRLRGGEPAMVVAPAAE